MTLNQDLTMHRALHDRAAWTGARPARRPIWISLLAAIALSGGVAWAQGSPPPAGGPYVLAKQAIAGGAGLATGGSYALTGTVAQPAVDPLAATGGAYQLSGGFHGPSVPRGEDLFANGFED